MDAIDRQIQLKSIIHSISLAKMASFLRSSSPKQLLSPFASLMMSFKIQQSLSLSFEFLDYPLAFDIISLCIIVSSNCKKTFLNSVSYSYTFFLSFACSFLSTLTLLCVVLRITFVLSCYLTPLLTGEWPWFYFSPLTCSLFLFSKFTFLIEVNISSLLFSSYLILFYDLTRQSKVMLRQFSLFFWKQSKQKLRSPWLSVLEWSIDLVQKRQNLSSYLDLLERMDLSSPLRTLPTAFHILPLEQNDIKLLIIGISLS